MKPLLDIVGRTVEPLHLEDRWRLNRASVFEGKSESEDEKKKSLESGITKRYLVHLAHSFLRAGAVVL